jgi:ABC-type transport system involved in multi-copper enzyme maturation permease subunit
MMALIRKDLRVNLVPIVGSAVVLALVYSLSFFENDGSNNTYFVMGVFGIIIIVIMAAAYGGIAFAQERRDRSADFLALLPVTRSRIVASKLVAAFLPMAAMWALNTAFLVAAYLGGRRTAFTSDVPGMLCTYGAIFMLHFGVAWMLSTFLTSPAIATAIALAVTAFLGLSFEHFSMQLRSMGAFYWAIRMASVGIACLIAGSIYYIKRIEP